MGGGQLKSAAGFVTLHTCLFQGLRVSQFPLQWVQHAMGTAAAACTKRAGLSCRQGCTQQACPQLCRMPSASCRSQDVEALQLHLEAALLLALSGPIPACGEH